MVLAFNIGNTRFTAGVGFTGSTGTMRFPSKSFESSEDFSHAVTKSISQCGAEPKNITGAIISSVNPGLTHLLETALKELFPFSPIIVSSELKTQTDFSLYDVKRLGSDRIAVCEAALEKYGAPVIVFDFGTATTINVIDNHARFLGGSILPGLTMGLNALSADTAQLPQAELSSDNPVNLIGADTRECLLSGAVFGNASMLDAMSQRIAEFLKQKPPVIITGGAASNIIPFCRSHVIHEPELLIEGLFLLYQKNEGIR